MSLDEAAGLWWRDVAQHKDSASTDAIRIQTLFRLFGKNTAIADIRTATVNDAIQKRRAETVRGKQVSPSTVNRDIIDTLRPILRHVHALYEDQGLSLPTIQWGKMRLPEPDEVRREFTAQQIAEWGAALGSNVERIFLGTALTYGPRFGELFFPPGALVLDDPGGPYVMLGRYKGRDGWRETRKDGSVLKVPLAIQDARVLGALASRAQAANLDTIWFDVRGDEVSEISYWGMHSRLRTAARAAGIPPGRIIHGMRHHAGTTLLRSSGNLMLVRDALGHKDVATTQRYAHASDDDLRAALARSASTNPTTRALLAPVFSENPSEPAPPDGADTGT